MQMLQTYLNYYQIITLKVYLDKSLGDENSKYVFDYTTYDDYDEEEHIKLRSLFNESTLQRLVQTVTVLNEFIIMMETDNVNLFELNFDIRTHLFSVFKSFKKPIEEIIGKSDTDETYKNFIEQFEKFITQAGVHKMEIPNIFYKYSETGKRAKSSPLTFGQLINKLKDVVLDVND